jgi:hypothetical protein
MLVEAAVAKSISVVLGCNVKIPITLPIFPDALYLHEALE